MRARILKACGVKDVGDSLLEISRSVPARSWKNEHRVRIPLEPVAQYGNSRLSKRARRPASLCISKLETRAGKINLGPLQTDYFLAASTRQCNKADHHRSRRRLFGAGIDCVLECSQLARR